MKKLKWFSSLLLSTAMMFTSVTGTVAGMVVPVSAEEEYYEEEYYEEEYSDDGDSEEYSDNGDSDGGNEDSSGEEEYKFERDPHVDTNEIEGWPQGDGVDADSAIVMDADTGAILYGKYIDEQKYPASITKVMTVLLALENGNLEDTVTFSEYAVYSIEYGSAHLGLTEGEQLTLEQCLYGIMLASANEISNAVAEHIGGSVENFADMMNAKAKELGCTNSHFVNPNGLHDPDHYVCARDMALITRAALQYDKFREIINTDEYHYPPTNKVKEDRYFVNHHSFLMDESYDGIIGGKTGYTDEAYNTLVTCVERDGMTLISVVLHAPGIDSEYSDTRTILDYGYDNFEQVTVENATQAKKNLTVKGIEDKDELAKIKDVDFADGPITIEDSTVLTLPKEADLSEVKAVMNFERGVLAYTYLGQQVGRTTFTYTGEWEEETEAPTEAAVSATEGETNSAAATTTTEKTSGAKTFFSKMSEVVMMVNDMIVNHDIIAVIAGAILLVIFIPLLILALSRSHKYKKMMRQRDREMKMRQRLEDEIEKKSAAQVEAELRARELEFQLEMERKKHQNNSNSDNEEE